MTTTTRNGKPTHKGLALLVIAISQLMVVLDATIVNVALNDIYLALGFTSQADLSWVVTGYTLTFGGFLLLGGKLAPGWDDGRSSSPGPCSSPSRPLSVEGRRARRCSSSPAWCRASAAR